MHHHMRWGRRQEAWRRPWQSRGVPQAKCSRAASGPSPPSPVHPQPSRAPPSRRGGPTCPSTAWVWCLAPTGCPWAPRIRIMQQGAARVGRRGDGGVARRRRGWPSVPKGYRGHRSLTRNVTGRSMMRVVHTGCTPPSNAGPLGCVAASLRACESAASCVLQSAFGRAARAPSPAPLSRAPPLDCPLLLPLRRRPPCAARVAGPAMRRSSRVDRGCAESSRWRRRLLRGSGGGLAGGDGLRASFLALRSPRLVLACSAPPAAPSATFRIGRRRPGWPLDRTTARSASGRRRADERPAAGAPLLQAHYAQPSFRFPRDAVAMH